MTTTILTTEIIYKIKQINEPLIVDFIADYNSSTFKKTKIHKLQMDKLIDNLKLLHNKKIDEIELFNNKIELYYKIYKLFENDILYLKYIDNNIIDYMYKYFNSDDDIIKQIDNLLSFIINKTFNNTITILSDIKTLYQYIITIKFIVNKYNLYYSPEYFKKCDDFINSPKNLKFISDNTYFKIMDNIYCLEYINEYTYKLLIHDKYNAIYNSIILLTDDEKQYIIDNTYSFIIQYVLNIITEYIKNINNKL